MLSTLQKEAIGCYFYEHRRSSHRLPLNPGHNCTLSRSPRFEPNHALEALLSSHQPRNYPRHLQSLRPSISCFPSSTTCSWALERFAHLNSPTGRVGQTRHMSTAYLGDVPSQPAMSASELQESREFREQVLQDMLEVLLESVGLVAMRKSSLLTIPRAGNTRRLC